MDKKALVIDSLKQRSVDCGYKLLNLSACERSFPRCAPRPRARAALPSSFSGPGKEEGEDEEEKQERKRDGIGDVDKQINEGQHNTAR